jgi:ribosomal S5-like protein
MCGGVGRGQGTPKGADISKLLTAASRDFFFLATTSSIRFPIIFSGAMSVCRSSRHFLLRGQPSINRASTCSIHQTLSLRPFHQSSHLHDDISQSPDPPIKNDSSRLPALRSKLEIAAEKRRTKRATEIKEIKERFVPYSEEEMEALSQYYTPEQMEALRAAEEAISTDDLAEQWGPRQDQWRLTYMDDLAQVDPFTDHQPEMHLGHAPVMRVRQERVWSKEELEWTERDEELASMSEEQLKERYDREFAEWEKTTGLDKVNESSPDLSEEEAQRMYNAILTTERPSLFPEAMKVDTTASRMEEIAAAAIDEALEKAGKTFPKLLDELPQSKAVLEPIEPGEWDPRYRLTDNQLPEQPGEDLTKDFARMGPFTHTDLHRMHAENLGEDFFNDHETTDRLTENYYYGGLGIAEMLYKIEKSGLAEEIKASLRPLYTYKGTHKEPYAKRILWPFVTDERVWAPDPSSHQTIKALFETVQTLKMDPIKKAELLAYSHWADTPKGDSLRPVLERTIAEHEVDPVAKMRFEIEQNKKRLLGLDRLGEELPLDIEGPNKHLYSSPMYHAIQPTIPKLRDPRVRYPALDDDALTIGIQRVSQQTGFKPEELRRFRTKTLVFHRVVNQTRKGKLQSLYALSVAGNEDGLLGIGEGKAFEPEDALLKARLQSLRNLAPVPRYEKRTIFGELHAKVGGCTVQLMSRPPG